MPGSPCEILKCTITGSLGSGCHDLVSEVGDVMAHWLPLHHSLRGEVWMDDEVALERRPYRLEEAHIALWKEKKCVSERKLNRYYIIKPGKVTTENIL